MTQESFDAQTARWIWPDAERPIKRLHLGATERAFLRDLVVWWDDAEQGAAGVEARMDAEHPEDSELLIDLFLNSGVLKADSGVIRNPYAGPEDNGRIEHAPDPAIVALFTGGAAEIAYEVSETDRALWNAANKTDEGINCKRPFGSEQPGRDLRPILDPDKAMTRATFAKLRATAEARMLLFQQFFVQNATLDDDLYIRGEDYIWRPASEVPDAEGPMLTRLDWCHRLQGMVHNQCRDYTKTGAALAQLIWEGRVTGSYSDLCTQMNLGNLHDDMFGRRYGVPTRALLETALEHFPEDNLPTLHKALTVTLIRLLNATGDFDAAKVWLQRAGLWEVDPAEATTRPLSPEAVMYLEGVICRYGLGEISEAAFFTAAFSKLRGGSSFTYDILHGVGRWGDGCPKDLPAYRYSRARAIAAQIQIMRGAV